MTNTAALPLMLAYRLRKYSPDREGIFLGYDSPNYKTVSSQSVEDAQRLSALRPDLFQVISEGVDVHFVVASGSKPSLSDLVEELKDSGAGRSAAQLELVAAVLVRGDQPGSYGNTYWDDAVEVLHLAACGPDWSEFRGVTSERWSDWHGTFAEDTYEDRLQVEFDCACGEVEQVRFGIEPPSLAQLFVSLEAGVIEKLFEV